MFLFFLCPPPTQELKDLEGYAESSDLELLIGCAAKLNLAIRKGTNAFQEDMNFVILLLQLVSRLGTLGVVPHRRGTKEK